MALTLEIEQKLKKAKLDEFFENNRAHYKKAAKEAYKYIKSGYPDGSPIRPDDIKGSLETVLKVHRPLQDFLSKGHLTQKYWYSHFSDLIIDRTLHEIEQEEKGDGS